MKRSDGEKEMAEFVVFSDLDGALLDERTFEWSAARQTIARLRNERIPLIFVSSKTRAEIEQLQETLGVSAPYSAENGALIVYGWKQEKTIGRDAADLEELARRAAMRQGARIELLSEMRTHRAAAVTGLPGSALEHARRRDHSAPFVLKAGSLAALQEEVAQAGARILPGKRLHHIVGPHDKGDAVRLLMLEYPEAITIAIGDGESDVPMLRLADRPIFQGPEPPPGIPPRTRLEPETGPHGWARAVGRTLEEALPVVSQGGAFP